MKQHNNSKPNRYYVSNSIQKVFTITIIGLYLVQTIFLAISSVTQLQQGFDLRSQLSYFFIYNLIPIILFFIAYFMNPRKLSRTSKSFESLLLALFGIIGSVLISMIFPLLLFSSNFSTNYALIQYAGAGISLLGYLGTLILLRRKGRWA